MSDPRGTILLFGMPRSGTTWLGKIFDSHPDTVYRHEPDSVTPFAHLPLMADPEDSGEHAAELQRFVAAMLRHPHEKVSASTPLFRKRYFGGARFALYAGSCYLAKAASRLRRGGGLRPLFLPRQGVPLRLVWKSIESLGRIGLLKQALPDSHPIQVLRHPCGHVSSVLRGEARHVLGDGYSVATDLVLFDALLDCARSRALGLTRADIAAMAPVERLATRWMLINEKAYHEMRAVGGYIVRYEDICAAPEPEVERMFAQVGLDCGPATRRFIEESTGADEQGYYAVTKDPLVAANKWREELSADDVARVMAVVGRSEVGRLYSDQAG